MKALLCYGDSNTYGYDPRSFLSDRYTEDIRWTSLLSQAGYAIDNQGVNGREIPHRSFEIDTSIRYFTTAKSDLLIMMLGSNDLLMNPGFTAEDVAERMKRFLLTVQKALPEQPILLIAPVAMQPGEWVQEKRLLRESARLAVCYQTLAKQLDINFADAGIWNVALTFDGVHFSESGHASFAAGLLNWLKTADTA